MVKLKMAMETKQGETDAEKKRGRPRKSETPQTPAQTTKPVLLAHEEIPRVEELVAKVVEVEKLDVEKDVFTEIPVEVEAEKKPKPSSSFDAAAWQPKTSVGKAVKE